MTIHNREINIWFSSNLEYHFDCSTFWFGWCSALSVQSQRFTSQLRHEHACVTVLPGLTGPAPTLGAHQGRTQSDVRRQRRPVWGDREDDQCSTHHVDGHPEWRVGGSCKQWAGGLLVVYGKCLNKKIWSGSSFISCAIHFSLYVINTWFIVSVCMYIPQWHNGEDACTLSNLETPFSTLCKSFVFHLILKNMSMLCLKEKRGLRLIWFFFTVMLKEEFWLLLLMEQSPYSTEIQVYYFLHDSNFLCELHFIICLTVYNLLWSNYFLWWLSSHEFHAHKFIFPKSV